jgi:monothiol glutaredoxin
MPAMAPEPKRDTPAERPLLDASRIAPEATRHMAGFHSEIVDEVKRAVAERPVVVVGMAQNPHVKNVRKALRQAGIEFEYLEYGSYLSKWRERLAIKLWTGWPTFPQVFVKGVLLGGEDLTLAAIADGSLARSLAG